jgi:hypothetical protein
MFIEQVTVDDGHWHSVLVFQAWETVKLQVDASVQFCKLHQDDFVFGHYRTNSDVYFGGIAQVSSLGHGV